MTKLLLLDLDGTVRQTISGAKFINDPQDQELIPEAAAALQRWAAAGGVIAACSNQAGVSAGYMTIGQAIDSMVRTMELAPQLAAVFFCPDSDGARCFYVRPDGSTQTLTTATFSDLHIRTFRKPGVGMLRAAMMRFQADESSTVFVGDRDEDRLAAVSAGVDFMTAEMWQHSRPLVKKAA